MTPAAAEHLAFAHEKIAEARTILERTELWAAGARSAYLAALAAARAIIREQTGKSPKTHTGTRSEIARLAKLDGRIDRSFSGFLAKGYEVKSDADYGNHFAEGVSRSEASDILATATRLVAHAETLLSEPDPPPAA